ncbi:MAG TPA: nucleoid occlusion protein [Methylomusa anaerophila]|uniref:Nucleoid occlusion protein n=1 Tax=Methylomusa anaerophila TaxID=1930071 RepID=A0A348AHN3_9FIRM|nr:nucleoid occlusion protein [Methylomusa anaerophila]BBB90581.1 nucleoid occlusion protein [Methylomusa anaerophila]HML88812.1 nucleoid occlusion protein [Methylomusa anaerophila]
MRNLAKLLGLNADKNNENKVVKVVEDSIPADKPVLRPVGPQDIADARGIVTYPVNGDPPSDDLPAGSQDATPALAEESNGSPVKLAIESIVPNPFQPRKTFNGDSLQELAASISEFGVIQPLLARRRGEVFELIAGERRLRAAKLAGLTEVPAIIRELEDKEMAELAMIENLQREDLHFLEEAEGFQQLIANFNFTQEELARRVGKNQSTIANKLRLLKLDPHIRQALVGQNLTERHARALLKLDDMQMQKEILDSVREKGLNVRETEDLIEAYIEDMSQAMKADAAPKQTVVKIIKDVRIFINTINSIVSQMKKNGMEIKYKQDFDGEYVNITMQIKNGKK